MVAMTRNVWVLLFAGALGMCIAPVVVFIGGIVGAELAPVDDLSTLPVACLVVGTAFFVIPVSKLTQVLGRKKVFLSGAVHSALASVLAAYAVSDKSFVLFNLAIFLLGGALAIIQQFRFAAMESVAPESAPKAASFILLGGLVAAVLGPELAEVGQNLLSEKFAGSFVLLAITALAGGVVLLFYHPRNISDVPENGGGRPMSVVVRNTAFWVAVLAATIGYAVMSYIMTATPVSMHVGMSHSLSETKWVIQSHILAMFAPSLVSGWLITRLGIYKLMLAGLVLYAACLMIALTGQDLMHYWLSLILLGVGWNFLFVSGTVLLPSTHRPEERFKAQGFNDFFVFFFQASASIMSGVIIYNFGWNYLVIFAIPFIVVQLFMLFLWKNRSDHSV